MNKNIALFFVFIFLLVFLSPKSIFASAREEVLGDSTNTNLFPPVAAGTGFLLPDSPFYFADKIYQNLKLAFAFTPENKAVMEGQILGERLAELRVMHAIGNNDGVNIALSEIEKEARNAAQYVKESAAEGKDVTVLAKQINDFLRDYRTILSTASLNSNEELSLKLDSTNLSLLSSKVDVDEFLNDADKDDAILSDLNTEAETAVLSASTKAIKTEKKLDNLEKRASRAAELQAKKDTAKKLLEAKKAELELKSQNEQELRPSVTPEQKSSTETNQ